MKNDKFLLDIKECNGSTGKQWKEAFKVVCQYYGKTMTDEFNEFLRERVKEFKKRNQKEEKL
jgi:hypothetical protein